MVSSLIKPDINYIETKSIDDEDSGHSSALYIVEIHGNDTVIVLGKPKYTFASKGVIFYPIYVIGDDDTIKSQIGVYESIISDTIQLVDSDGDIDLEKLGDPLLYTFATTKYLDKLKSDASKYTKDKNIHGGNGTDDMDTIEPVDTSPKEDDEEDVLKLKVNATKISKEKTAVDQIIERGIFTINPSFVPPPLLPEETDADSAKNKLDYKDSISNPWVSVFMKNNYYDIQHNEGGGDCYFALVRDAFLQIGKKTTVQKLRAIVANSITDEVFTKYRELFLQMQSQKESIKHSMRELKATNDLYAIKIKKVEDKQKKKDIIDETKRIKNEYAKKMEELKELTKTQHEYTGSHIKEYDTIDKFRSFVLTSHFWADAWAISVLEQHLQYKTILLSEDAANKKAPDNVMLCGDNPKTLALVEPHHYIMASVSGYSYKIIAYKNKKIFTFKEVPYDIKILIVNKCLERNAGVFYKIQDFKNFKSQLGMDPNEGESLEEESGNTDLYDSRVTFQFYNKSIDAKPGKGIGEVIAESERIDFVELGKIPDWRRKLDDMWSGTAFDVDGHRWLSVEHYVQACKFKKGFPDFYKMFAIDGDSITELAKDPEIAKSVGDLSKTKYKYLRPKEVSVDPDYDLGRKGEEREVALKAKFTQISEMRNILKGTRTALLRHSVRRHVPTPDIPLMTIRNELLRTM